jgi:hypothetical protein
MKINSYIDRNDSYRDIKSYILINSSKKVGVKMAEKLNIYLNKINKFNFLDSYDAQNNIEMVERTFGVSLIGELRNYVGSMDRYSEIEMDNGEEIRLLEVLEVVDSNDYFGVDFTSEGLIPLFELEDNDIIVYDIGAQLYCKYSLENESVYKASTDLFGLI